MRHLRAALLVLIVAAPALAEISFPVLSGRVVDDAHILSSAAKEQLTTQLEALEARNGDQLVVVTVPSLNGREIEEFGYQLGRHWGIGQKGKNNGVLFIIASKEHRMRIEVGYGLEGSLTDAQSSHIIQGVVVPQFKRGQMEQGVLAGVQAIVTVLETGAVDAPAHSGIQAWDDISTEMVMGIVFLLFLFSQVVLFILYVVLWCIGKILALCGFGGILAYVRRQRDRIYPKDRLFIAWLLKPSRNIYGSGGGFGSGSGGGFSGRGGSFGGGGSSGSW